MSDVRLIIDPPLAGPWNMAVDELLLADAIENNVATLRFYQWSEPTLSLGYFQHYDERTQHVASRECTIIRRQSGGGAILHDRELTYSLALPGSHPLARQTGDLYNSVHQAFITVLTAARSSDMPPATLRTRGEPTEPLPAAEPFLCFQRQSPGDVILVPDHPAPAISPQSIAPVAAGAGWKVLGSAQRRHRGAILQHGSLLLEMSPAAPELLGLRDLTALNSEIDTLIMPVCTQLSTQLDLRLIPGEISASLESKAADLSNTKYSAAVWTKRR